MLLLVPWLPLFAGVFLLFSGLRYARVNEQTAWTQVDGMVIRSQVEFDGELYYPSISYEYSIHSQRYVGNQVRPMELHYNWQGPAKRICLRYPVGSKVFVYVDLNRPAVSLLETRKSVGGAIVIYCTSTLLILGGLLFLSA